MRACLAIFFASAALAARRDCSEELGTITAAVRNQRSAERAGLHYVSTQGPGWTTSAAARRQERIVALGIPPSYREVRMATDPRAHIQATAVNEAGDIHYYYHPKWVEARAREKFARLRDFAAALPAMRRASQRHLAEDGMGRNKVLATVLELLHSTAIRVGNEEYAEANGTYGLTTFLKSHASVRSGRVHFSFIGKANKPHEVDVEDADLALVVRQLLRQPGERLFQYVDEAGDLRSISSTDVNAYIQEISGGVFTAKDFRTYKGTTLALRLLSEAGVPNDAADAALAVRDVLEEVSEALGNTPTVARDNYIDPKVLDAYRKGLLEDFGRLRDPLRALERLDALDLASP